MYKCKYGDKVFYASDIIKGNGFTVCNIGFGNTLDFYDDDKVRLTYTSQYRFGKTAEVAWKVKYSEWENNYYQKKR